MKQFGWVAVLMLLTLCVSAHANDCQHSPHLAGSCFVVHGKMYNANGGSLARIWKIGTNHVLGVVGWENIDLPPEIGSHIQSFDDVLFGDFLVCPYTEEETGHMQMVCVQSGTHLRSVPAKKQ
jgi:hypothetical protein